MASIIEKGTQPGLFTNEVEINGKYATFTRYLRDEIKVFPTYREIYLYGAVIGFLNNLKETDDTSDKVPAASIFPTELKKRRNDLKFLYRVMMINTDEPSFHIEDYMNRAFRDDSLTEEETNLYPDKLAENMKLFNSYACGGIEYLYNMFQNTTDVSGSVDTLYEYLNNFSVDVGLAESAELPDFDPID